jgi:uncharacterized membrane protein YsdA (DUF1294 family)/cold shock CspA family protein
VAPQTARTNSRSSGTVVDWFDDRGYGFIETKDRERLFFHISEVRDHYARARAGDIVTFALGVGRNGKPAAVDVQVAGVNPRTPEAVNRGSERPFARESYRVYGALVMIVLLIGALIFDRVPIWLPGIYLVVGALSAMLYASDKKSAEAGAWRTAETTLHAVDLAGGIIGGLLAQHIFRHKTAKGSFVIATAVIAAAHLVLIVALAVGSLSPAAIEDFLRATISALQNSR